MKNKLYKNGYRMPIGRGLVLFMLFILSADISAQTLDSLLSEAYRSNPQLQSLRHKITASEHYMNSVNSLPPPTLGIEFNSLSFSKLDIWNEAFSQNLTFSQMIPLGGKVSAMVNMAKTGSSVAVNEYEAFRVVLTSKIKMSYYTIWQYERTLEVQKRFISLMKELLKTNETMLYTNKISQADILMLQSEILNLESQLLILENRKKGEVSNINRLAGKEISASGIRIQSILEIPAIHIDEKLLIEELKAINPSLKKMSGMVMMNRAEIIANEKELIPDLMIGGMVMRMPKGMAVTTKTDPMMIGMGETEYMYGLMASITLPFAPWSRGKYDGKRLELESRIKSIEAEKLEMEREMVQKVHEIILKINSTKELISLYSEKVLPLETSYLELKKTSFFNNNEKLSSVIEASKMLLMNEMNLFMAKADYYMSIAELEMMVGREILK